VLLYDLTSTYFEGAMEENPKAKYGSASLSRLYSYPLSWRRDANIVFSLCSQLVADLPLAYSKSMESHLSPIATVFGAPARIHDIAICSCHVWWDKYRNPCHILASRPDRRIRYFVGSWRRPAVGTAILFCSE
jgi:hypothetical protein